MIIEIYYLQFDNNKFLKNVKKIYFSLFNFIWLFQKIILQFFNNFQLILKNHHRLFIIIIYLSSN